MAYSICGFTNQTHRCTCVQFRCDRDLVYLQGDLAASRSWGRHSMDSNNICYVRFCFLLLLRLSRHLYLVGPWWPLGPVSMPLLPRLSWEKLRGFCLACTCYVSNSSTLVAPRCLKLTESCRVSRSYTSMTLCLLLLRYLVNLWVNTGIGLDFLEYFLRPPPLSLIPRPSSSLGSPLLTAYVGYFPPAGQNKFVLQCFFQECAEFTCCS